MHPDSIKIADLVELAVEHRFTSHEQVENSEMLNRAFMEKQDQENKKKVSMAEFKQKIDEQELLMKRYSAYLANGYTYREKSCELWLDFYTKKRQYIVKETGEIVKEEAFHAADYQKQISFELEESNRAAQINENNAAGEFANGDALDNVISLKNSDHEPINGIPDDIDEKDDDLFKPEAE